MTAQFSQKHYVAIAKVIAADIEVLKLKGTGLSDGTGHERAAVRRVAVNLALMFAADNPKFRTGSSRRQASDKSYTGLAAVV